MKQFVLAMLTLSFFCNLNAQRRLGFSPPGDTSIVSIKTKLGIPFGKIARLEVEIYDGDSLRMHSYLGTYLLKVNSVNGNPIADTLFLKFTDETGKFPNDDFRLSKLIYGKKVESLSAAELDEMNRNYVGKKFTIMAYETGHFTGMPAEYYKYRPIASGINFTFEHYLVVISKLTK